MNLYVTDTHALYWHLVKSAKLSVRAAEAFDEGARGAATIYVPAIVLCEFHYFNKKVKGALNFAEVYRRLESVKQFVLLPLNPSDVLELDAVPQITEMHDRLIVAAAIRLGASLITADHAITASGLTPVVW